MLISSWKTSSLNTSPISCYFHPDIIHLPQKAALLTLYKDVLQFWSCSAVWLFALSPHSKEGPGLNPGWSRPVWSWHALPMNSLAKCDFYNWIRLSFNNCSIHWPQVFVCVDAARGKQPVTRKISDQSTRSDASEHKSLLEQLKMTSELPEESSTNHQRQTKEWLQKHCVVSQVNQPTIVQSSTKTAPGASKPPSRSFDLSTLDSNSPSEQDFNKHPKSDNYSLPDQDQDHGTEGVYPAFQISHYFTRNLITARFKCKDIRMFTHPETDVSA